MKNVTKSIETLKWIIDDLLCANMNRSTVKDYLGELIVKRKLEEEGYNVIHKGNQSGYDLEIPVLKVN